MVASADRYSDSACRSSSSEIRPRPKRSVNRLKEFSRAFAVLSAISSCLSRSQEVRVGNCHRSHDGQNHSAPRLIRTQEVGTGRFRRPA